MQNRHVIYILIWTGFGLIGHWAGAQQPLQGILPEQRALQIRSPDQLPSRPIPRTPPPATVTDPQWDANPVNLSLSEVLNISLQNLDVVRVLSGVTANSTGRTIYDVAINNTGIDVQRGLFDPNLSANNLWTQNRLPSAVPDLIDPTITNLESTRNNRHALNFGLSQRLLTGGNIDFGVVGSNNRFPNLITPLNPQINSSPSLQFTQPLLQGAGRAVNEAPIVIAMIDTERSFFQFKDSVQRHVLSVVQGYWQLVQARTELWAREQQVRQLQFALKRAEDRVEVGDARLGELSQARVAFENFRAGLLIAEGNLLARESALRNVLGLSPFDNDRIFPTSPLIDERLEWNWNELLDLAEQYRPDVIELKLILEADQQRLLVRQNDTLPRLDAIALYRWNGIEGTMPNGSQISGGGFDDWALGVNFSVPLGLRTARASLRQQELLIQRDQLNLQQGLHQASHDLAVTVRNLELAYAQYRRYQEVRQAAQDNLDQQIEIGNELEQFIVLLQAIVDWGNAVSSEAQALVLYNSELAALELQTGTILESHGIAFVEERFGSLGPLGRRAVPVMYPATTPPTPSVDRYPSGEKPSEERFNLVDPLEAFGIGQPAQPRNSDQEVPRDFAPPDIRLTPDNPTAGENRSRSSPLFSGERIKKLFRSP